MHFWINDIPWLCWKPRELTIRTGDKAMKLIVGKHRVQSLYIPYILGYKPGLLFPSPLSILSFKTRLAFKRDRCLFVQYRASSWPHERTQPRPGRKSVIQQPLLERVSATSIAFSLSNAWAIGLTKLTGADAEHPYSFVHAIASAHTKTTLPANWLVW
jgi:hypothetical protein